MIDKKRILKVVKETDKNFAPYYDVIPKLIRNRNYKKGIEVGVFAGGHAEAILKTNIDLLVGIDPYKIYKNGGMPGGIVNQDEFDYLYDVVIKRLHCERYVHFKLTSDAAFPLIKNVWGDFDFVFIDGLHTYDQIKRDLDNYSKLIRKGGVIVCHDYDHVYYPQLTTAIDEFSAQHNIKIIKGPLHLIYMEWN
jgi:hypothetical protein